MIFGSIGGLFGGKKASKKLSEDLAAIAEQNQFQPFNVSGPLGSGIFEGTQGTASLSGPLQASFDSFGGLLSGLHRQAKGFNPRSFENSFFDSIDRFESQREAEAFSSLESRLFNNSGVHTGTFQQTRDFRDTLDQRRHDRSVQSVLASQDFFTNQLNQILALEQGRLGLGASALDPLRAGANFGQIQHGANQANVDLLTQSAGIKRGGQAAFAQGIGGLADDALGFFGPSTGSFFGF